MGAAAPDFRNRQATYEGRTLGGFRLVREIACGGMATVYLGHKIESGGIAQVAAVKVIHPHLAHDADIVDMFVDEARIASRMHHPNICGVLEFGKTDGTYFLAMEYVMGETWSEVMARMAATPEAESMIAPVLAQVLSQACEGLHAAHETRDALGISLQIVHRDISPHNIMVGYDGKVRVLDFGIASAEERLHTTRNGAVKGRLSYMAPEQMRGLGVDRRADVWSLGVVLWEGLARRRLFRRDNEAKTVLAVTFEPLPSLSGYRHSIPRALEKIALRTLQRDREARYPSARALGLELSRWATNSLAPAGESDVSWWMQRLFVDEIEMKTSLLHETADGPLAFAPALVGDDRRRRPMRRSARLSPISTVRHLSRTQTQTRPHWSSKKLAVGALLVFAALFTLRGGQSATGPTLVRPPVAPNAAQETARVVQPRAVASSTAQKTAGVVRPRPVAPNAGQKTASVVQPRPVRGTAHPPGRRAAVAANAIGASAGQSGAEGKTDLAFTLEEIGILEEERANSARPPSRLAKTGLVSITTLGAWADVYLGARMLGTTPVRLSLPVGVRMLRLRRLGKGPDILRRVAVDSREDAHLTVSLQ